MDIFVNGAEIYKFTEKDFEIKTASLFLIKFLKYFVVNNMKKT